jgi:DNA-binding MarR family transcriptional regulator
MNRSTLMMLTQSPQRPATAALRGIPYTGAWSGFLRTHATLLRKLDAELEEAHGLPLSSFEVLLHLSWAPEHRMHMGELSESVLFTRSGLRRLLRGLEAEGLVQIEPCPEDRRGACAVLTEAGLDRLCEAHPTHLAGVREHFFEHFSEVELRAMAKCWRRVLSSA